MLETKRPLFLHFRVSKSRSRDLRSKKIEYFIMLLISVTLFSKFLSFLVKLSFSYNQVNKFQCFSITVGVVSRAGFLGRVRA